jgi:hypothetical protein
MGTKVKSELINTKKIMPKNKIHFEISERKMILRLFDVIFLF